MLEAEETVLEFGGLLELAMAACRDEQEEEEEDRVKATASETLGVWKPTSSISSKELVEAAGSPSHGDGQKKRKLAEATAEAATFASPAKKSHRAYDKLPPATGQRGWLQKAVEMGGTRPELVLRKRMFATDLNHHHTRLLLPCAHRGDPSRGGVELLLQRLTAAELGAVLGGEGVPVTLLDRWGREYGGAAVRCWPSNEWFVVNGGGAWMGVVEENALRVGDVVDIFCFRAAAGRGEGVLVLAVSTEVSVEEEMRRRRERCFLLPGTPARAGKRKPVACCGAEETNLPSQNWPL